jgi:hypothetical protein
MDLSTKLKIAAIGGADGGGLGRAGPRLKETGCGGRLRGGLGHRRPFAPIVRNALPWARMPSGSGRDRLAATTAAAEPSAGLGDCQGLRQEIDVDVGRAAAIRAGCGDGASAVQAHVGEGHRRAGVAAHVRPADC